MSESIQKLYRETVSEKQETIEQQAQQILNAKAEMDYWARWCQEEPTQKFIQNLTVTHLFLLAKIAENARNFPNIEDAKLRAGLIEAHVLMRVLNAMKTGTYTID